MLLTNQFKYFNKAGENVNPDFRPSLYVEVIDPTGAGKNADIRAYTDYSGRIIDVQIVNPGFDYSINTFINFVDLTSQDNVLTVEAGYTLDANGGFIAISVPSTADNNDFPFPGGFGFTNYFTEKVSTGLIASENLFIVEKVLCEIPGTLTGDTTSGSEVITNVSFSGLSINPTLLPGCKMISSYFPEDTLVIAYDPIAGELLLSKEANATIIGGSATFRKYEHTYPKADLYGPFPITNIVGNGTAVTLEIENYIRYGNISIDRLNVITLQDTSSISSLEVGMLVIGQGIPSGTSIAEISPIGQILLTKPSTAYVPSGNYIQFLFYNPHYLDVGSKIYYGNAGLGLSSDVYTITNISDLAISFSSDAVISSQAINDTYKVVPQFVAQIGIGSDPEWFLYDVNYGVDYPTIEKKTSFLFELQTDIPGTDTFTSGNGEFIRIVASEDELVRKPFQLNVALKADYEGVYVANIEILDITFTYSDTKDQPLFTTIIEGEVEGEDERLGLLLENFGRDVDREQELIFRDSDINEDLVNYRLLNQKRKEMLLQGDQIWPYVGSYKGLVNIINWFGYYDIRIKEYFLNINQEDTYYGKYRQEQIPFQLSEKGINPKVLNLVPSKHYKKTSLFGLFYDIVRNSGEFDEFGVPETEDAFVFTNEEVLIKLFALKAYLKEKFLPLNARIVDITGEGVYYERYAVNTWSDRNDQIFVDAGRRLDFTNTNRSQVIDLRPYDPDGGLLSPELTELVNTYYDRYTIKDFTVNTSFVNGPFMGEIPDVSFPGAAKQNARGRCKMRGFAAKQNPWYLSDPTGTGYQIGDIITLSGGTYENPIRITVESVSSGNVTSFSIVAGTHQGSSYTTLPRSFSQATVLRAVGTQYEIPNGVYGFTIPADEVPFEIEDITFYDLGIGYVSYPQAVFTWKNNPAWSVSSYSGTPGVGSLTVFSNVQSSVLTGGGTGATFDVTANVGTYGPVYVHSSGTGYTGSGSVLISGLLLGGASPANDLTVLLTSTTGPTYDFTIETTKSQPAYYYNDGEYVKKYSDAPGIPVGAPVNLSTTFEVTWDEVIYSWDTFSGGNDAVLKAWTDVLPNGSGQISTIQIVSQGSDYTSAPTLTVSGGGGYGATAIGSVKSGKLKIEEYTITSVSSSGGGTNNQLVVTPGVTGAYAITNSAYVAGTGITGGVLVDSQPSANTIILGNYNNTPAVTTLNIGDKIYVHQGAVLSANGSNFTSNPLVSVNGGHTNLIYTWDKLGRKEFYQMEWKASLTSPTEPGTVFFYRSGLKDIDELINHTFIAPYTGKYTIELDVYDTNNNISNRVKRDVLEVYIPESDFVYISRYVEDCKDTWNEFKQIPIPTDRTPSAATITANTPLNLPEPITYSWENAVGRWVNITFNKTIWDDCDVNWDSLYVSDLSDVNMPNFPECNDIEVLQISSEDVYEGTIIGYSDSTTYFEGNLSINPTIIIAGQYTQPPLDPVYDPTDWIFIRRDNNVYHLEILAADYSVVGRTYIELTSLPPQAFRSSPTTWEALREIGGTIAVNGNQIYDETTNPNGFKIDEFLRLQKTGSTPIISRAIVSAKYVDPTYGLSGVEIENGASTSLLKKTGAFGKIYKIRDFKDLNGNLIWTPEETAVKTVTNVAGTGVNTTSSVITFTNVLQSNTTGIGSAAEFTVEISTSGVYTVTMTKGGIDYAVGDTITIFGSSLGGAITVNDLTFDVATLNSASAWKFIVTRPDEPTISDHIGQILINPAQITCDPLDEIRPGFTRIKLYVYDSGNLLYEQTFRTKHLYLDTSTMGTIYDAWDSSAIVVDVIGLNGGELLKLNDYLNNVFIDRTTTEIYLEYQYNEFSTRERYYEDVGADERLYMDFNQFPYLDDFESSVTFGGAYQADHLNWYYDHGILGNDYSQKVLNTGIWKGGAGTLITLEDNNFELYRTDTFFLACQQRFDEDYAEGHLGTRVQTWSNYEEMIWQEFCGSTWDTLDFTDSLYCNYTIDTVESNGGIKFNEYPFFNFQGIVGGMSDARKFAVATQELNRSDNPGIQKFHYSPSQKYAQVNCTDMLPTLPSAPDITSLKEGPDGKIWIMTQDQGVFYYENSIWTNISTAEGLDSVTCLDIAFNSAGITYIVTDTGLNYDSGDLATWTTVALPAVSGGAAQMICDIYDRIIVVFDGAGDGLQVWENSTWTDVIPGVSVTGVVEDRDTIGLLGYSLLWVTTTITVEQYSIDNTGINILTGWALPSARYPGYGSLALYDNGGSIKDLIYAEVRVGGSRGRLIAVDSGNFAVISNGITPHSGGAENYSTLRCALQVDHKNRIWWAPLYYDGFTFTPYLFKITLTYTSQYNPLWADQYQEYIEPCNSIFNCAYIYMDTTDRLWSGREISYLQLSYGIAANHFDKCLLNTFTMPDAFLYLGNEGNLIEYGDAFYGSLFEDDTYVINKSIVGTGPNGENIYDIELSKDIKKKASFTAQATNGSYVLKNVLGLHSGELRVGETISWSLGGSSTVVLRLTEIDGMIREIYMTDVWSSASNSHEYFDVEWICQDYGVTLDWLSTYLNQDDLDIYAKAKNPSVDNLGYLVGTDGVTFLPPQPDKSTEYALESTTISHTFPLGHFYTWFGYGLEKIGAFQTGLDQFIQNYRYAQTYISLGTSPFGKRGWYPADTLPPAYSYTNDSVFSNYLEAQAQAQRLPFEKAIGGSYTWEETHIGKRQDKLPAGSSVLLSADASDMAGKTKFLWRLTENDIVLTEITDNRLLWTFDYPGEFDVELTIEDTNGNKSTKTKKSFLIVYESTE